MQGASALIEEDVYGVLELDSVVGRRESYGGTAAGQVRSQIERARATLGSGDHHGNH
jgi:argininosuccinate lyase